MCVGGGEINEPPETFCIRHCSAKIPECADVTCNQYGLVLNNAEWHLAMSFIEKVYTRRTSVKD